MYCCKNFLGFTQGLTPLVNLNFYSLHGENYILIILRLWLLYDLHVMPLCFMSPRLIVSVWLQCV